MIYALMLSWHATRHSSNGLSSCVMTFCLLNLWGVGDAQQQLAAQSRVEGTTGLNQAILALVCSLLLLKVFKQPLNALYPYKKQCFRIYLSLIRKCVWCISLARQLWLKS